MDVKTRLSRAVIAPPPPRAVLALVPDPPDDAALVSVDHGGAIGDVAQLLGEQIAGRVRVRNRLLAQQEELSAMLRAVNGEIEAITCAKQAYERAREWVETPALAAPEAAPPTTMPPGIPPRLPGSGKWAERFADWARRHGGVITMKPFRECYGDNGNLAQSSMTKLLAHGEYERIGRGLYRRVEPGAQGVPGDDGDA